VKVTILTTGGTIEKTYNERDGSLRNEKSILEEICGSLRLPDLTINHVPVMYKDSLDMTDADRDRILAAVRSVPPDQDAVVILHGTDTLARTGTHLSDALPDLARPVILTGAMRPFEFRDSDAAQNVTEALLACRLLPPGVYVVMHNQALNFPGVYKDPDLLTFRKPCPPELEKSTATHARPAANAGLASGGVHPRRPMVDPPA
jgi:L-asparaginase